ncbi:MAG: amino acid adenylation domain-containing protein, partial [bacterium]|nr:amino acid adenylation domain-containing protein [bacterium]
NFRRVGVSEGIVIRDGPEQPGQIEQVPVPVVEFPKIENKNLTAKFDMTFMIQEQGEDVCIMLEYYTGIFKRETMRRLAMHFKNIVKAVVKEPYLKLTDIDILCPSEKHRVLHELNDTARRYPLFKTLQELFTEQVVKTPDHIAVVAGRHAVTYNRLNETARQLAQYLYHRKHIQPGDPVGILMYPSIDLIASILGILKAGGAFVPMVPDLPEKRLEQIIADAQIEVVISQKTCIRLLNRLQRQNQSFHTFLCMDSSVIYRQEEEEKNELAALDEELWQYAGSNATHDITGLAYVLYTSGTTGKPKGVMMVHRNLVNYTRWFSEFADITGQDHALLTSSFAFDALYTQFFSSLLNGGGLHVICREDYLQGHELLRYIQRHRVTYIKVTPSLFSIIVNSPNFSWELCKSLRFAMLGGEAIKVEDVEKAHQICPFLSFINHYGPTETTIGSSAQFIDFTNLDLYKAHPTIGKPIANTRVYILDKDLQLVPPGIAGELVISGEGVGVGYLNQPQLTAEKFILPAKLPQWTPGKRKNENLVETQNIASKISRNPSPIFSPSPLYMSGDLARWTGNETIECLGRIDQQVKIRGYRIELQEIESQLLMHPQVKEAVVINRETGREEKAICAYIVAGHAAQGIGQEGDTLETALRDFLARVLPEYMIPSYFVKLDKIPLTIHWKLDIKKLPEPGVTLGGDYAAPGNQLERDLVEIWSEVLGVSREKLSIDANFFQLGGHSLNATILVSKIHKKLEAKLPLAEVFKLPSIRGQAGYIKRAEKNKYESLEPEEKKEYYDLSSAQKRLYFLQQLDLESTSYNTPRVFPLGKGMEKKKLELALKLLINRHETFRTSFITVSEFPVQRVYDYAEFKTEYYLAADGKGGETGDGGRKTGNRGQGTDGNHASDIRQLTSEFIRPFDLSRAPLLRSGMIEMKDGNYIWLVDMHHIISDGTTSMILTEDFMSLYNENELEPLRLQYKDFSSWQNRLFANGEIETQEKYWLDLYADAGDIPRLDLITDFKRPEMFTFAGDRYDFMLEREEAVKFKALGSDNNGTLFMNILAALDTLFYKYTG